MHTQSLPPADRDDQAEDQPGNPIRDRLLTYRDTQGLTNSSLAKRLGYSPAVVSQYLAPTGNKYPGDTASIERRVLDLLTNEERRRLAGVTTLACEATRQLRTACELIRRTNDMGAVVAPPGRGKTRAVELYVEENPTAVLFRVKSWTKDLASIEGALFEAVGSAGYDNRTKRAAFLANKLRGSNRLLVVDDAHKLTRPALQWLFDFHDDTACPVVLVGTYELGDKLRDDAQRLSRVGYWSELKPEKPVELIQHLISTLAPTSADQEAELLALCEQVAEQHGHFRAVHKQLKLAAEIKEARASLTWVAAFKAAHTKLLREYSLN